MKIGIALGSGGARGLAHIGVVKALHEEGVEISYISGCSMGAIVGALYSATRSPKKLDELAESITWKKLLGLFIPTLSKSGLVDGNRVAVFIEKHLPAKTFKDLSIPLSLLATDIIKGELVRLSEGELLPAIRASFSIPLVFTPIQIDGRALVDGGLISPVPVNVVRDMGADFVIGVNVLGTNKSWLSTDQLQEKVGKEESYSTNFLTKFFNNPDSVPAKHNSMKTNLGPILVITQTIGMLISQMSNYQVANEQPDLLIEPETTMVNVYDFHRGDAIIEDAYQLTKEIIAENHYTLVKKS